MEEIDFWEDFVVGNSKKLQKLGLEGKISWALNMFTFGPTAHPTLAIVKLMGFFAVFAPLQLSLNGWQCLEPVVMGSHTKFGRKSCSNWCYRSKCFLGLEIDPRAKSLFSLFFHSLFFPFLFPMFLFFPPFLFPLLPSTRVHSLFFLVGIPWVCDLLSIFKKVIKDQNMRTLWAKKPWAQSKGITQLQIMSS